MIFKMPEPDWEYLDAVAKQWNTTVDEILKLAACGKIVLFAKIVVVNEGDYFFREHGDSIRKESWKDGEPVKVTLELAEKLLSNEGIYLDRWETKAGEKWVGGVSTRYELSPRPILGASWVLLFREERERFERAHGFDVNTDGPHVEQEVASTTKEDPNSQAGLATPMLARVFDGIERSEKNWRNLLADYPKWTAPALISKGARGGSAAVWNPVKFGSLLISRNGNNEKRIGRLFRDKEELIDWRDRWQERLSTLSDYGIE